MRSKDVSFAKSRDFISLQPLESVIRRQSGINAAIQLENFRLVAASLSASPTVPKTPHHRRTSACEPCLDQAFTLNLTVQHNGELEATGIIATVALPPNIIFIIAQSEAGDCLLEEDNVICQLGYLSHAAVATAESASAGCLAQKSRLSLAPGQTNRRRSPGTTRMRFSDPGKN